jgi:hypothetical protein
MEASVDPQPPGSRLDADYPENGVLIPRRNTADPSHAVGLLGDFFLGKTNFGSAFTFELNQALARRNSESSSTAACFWLDVAADFAFVVLARALLDRAAAERDFCAITSRVSAGSA